MIKKNNQNDNSGSFVGHLTELRSRLVKSFIFLIFLFIISYIFSTDIYRFLVQPYADAVLSENLERRLIFTALHEAFLTYLKVAFFAAFFISSPFFLVQLWKFIAPGLYKNEKKAIRRSNPGSRVCTLGALPSHYISFLKVSFKKTSKLNQ